MSCSLVLHTFAPLTPPCSRKVKSPAGYLGLLGGLKLKDFAPEACVACGVWRVVRVCDLDVHVLVCLDVGLDVAASKRISR